MNREISEDTRFRVLRVLEQNPDFTQRQIARELGVTLGGVNYCLKALAGKGQVKIQNFSASGNKIRYVYVLTPKGLAERAALAGRFLQRKMAEYEALKAEIAGLRREQEGSGPDASAQQ